MLAKNDRLAERNRGWLEGRGILALNLMSSPGAGKTTLLERTIRDARRRAPGQRASRAIRRPTLDAERIARDRLPGGPGQHRHRLPSGCRDGRAARCSQLAPPANSVVMIENVGNLVCPALFDLGERARVVILSVTEGEDKPLKYPHMFRART